MTKFDYPIVKRDENYIEKIHGIDINDPYRWLENESNEEVKKFCEQQQNLTMSYIQDAPDRDNIKSKLVKLWNYPKFDVPFKRGDYYYMFKNSGLQNQNVLYRFKNINDEHEIFLDPNTFSDDGSNSLSNIQFSKDAKFAAYAISLSGSDWLKIKVLNVETKEHLSDELVHSKFTGISWTHDNKGFFYSKYEKSSNFDLKDVSADTHHKLYYHRINTKQIDDILVHSTPCNPKFLIVGKVSNCGDYLLITQLLRCGETLWYYVKLKDDPIDKPFLYYPIVDKFEGYEDDYITNVNNFFYFKTNRNAPNYKICRLDINNPHPSKWVDIVPEDKKNVLNEVICVDGNKLALIYMKDVVDQLEIRNLEDGTLFKKFNLPIGTINSLSGRKESNEIFVLIASFLSPGQIYHYNFSEGGDECKLFSEIKLDTFDPNEYITKQEFFTTKDNKWKIPMFVVYHKEIELNSNNPCILYGYGGFNIAVQPGFSIKRLVFMKHFKGVYAIANIRGGSEYGTEFYNDGKLLNKQNCFDDFIQSAELLIEKGYTNRNKIAIEGGSNGGLLVATAANQRPDLFAAVICHVGVLDLLRFHLFTIGSAWTSDYGDCQNKKEFENQFKLSPLHNIPENCEKYPATLVITSDHDNRVSPLHSFKFISELQYKLGKKLDSPFLLRVDMKAGHGKGRSTEKAIEECVDIFCFLQKSLNLSYFP